LASNTVQSKESTEPQNQTEPEARTQTLQNRYARDVGTQTDLPLPSLWDNNTGIGSCSSLQTPQNRHTCDAATQTETFELAAFGDNPTGYFPQTYTIRAS